nr:hypothetical protein [Morchella crassipes]
MHILRNSERWMVIYGLSSAFHKTTSFYLLLKCYKEQLYISHLLEKWCIYWDTLKNEPYMGLSSAFHKTINLFITFGLLSSDSKTHSFNLFKSIIGAIVLLLTAFICSPGPPRPSL